MSLETRSTVISKTNLIDQVAALLYAFGFVQDDETIVDIELEWDIRQGHNGEIPLTYTVRKGMKEVNIIKGNGA